MLQTHRTRLRQFVALADAACRAALLSYTQSQSLSESESESHSPPVSRPISGGPIDVTSALCLSRSRCPSPGSGQVNRRRRLLQYKSIAIYATAHTKAAAVAAAEGGAAELRGQSIRQYGKGHANWQRKISRHFEFKMRFRHKNIHK